MNVFAAHFLKTLIMAKRCKKKVAESIL